MLVEPGTAFSIKGCMEDEMGFHGEWKKRPRSKQLLENIFQCFTDWNGTWRKQNFDVILNLKMNIVIG